MEDKRPVRFRSYCPLIFRVASRPSFLLVGGFMWRVGLIRPAVSLLTAAMDFPLAALARELLPQRRGQAWSNDCRGCSWADDAATNREQRSPRVFQMEHVVVALAAPFSGYLVGLTGSRENSAAFSYQELDLSSVRFLGLPLFFAVDVLRGLLGAFFERAGALRFGMGRIRRARNLRLVAEWSSRVRARIMKLDRPLRRAARRQRTAG